MGRAGSYTSYLGVKCFNPAALPPVPEIDFTKIQNLLSQADRALARLDGASSTVPNPDLFVYAFMRQEATLSSQIEGTQASLDDLFEREVDEDSLSQFDDVDEIVNYIVALNWGVENLDKLPLSLRMIREMHKRLLASGRGASKNAGEFRDGQNHIGPPGCTIDEATFVPPAVPLMIPALTEWERFLHDGRYPALVKAGLIHAQFETIHPFWDGNGRIGRILLTLMLISEDILARPLLYISLFFKIHKAEYYRRLQAVRDEGDWEGWLEFFLRGVRVTCRSALSAVQRINELRERTLAKAHSLGKSQNYGFVAEALFRNPYTSAKQIAVITGSTSQTGQNIIRKFAEANIISEATGRKRRRIYIFQEYLDLLNAVVQDLEKLDPPKAGLVAEETKTSSA